MVGKEEAIEIHHWSNMIISVMSISGGIIEPNRNHSQLGLFLQHVSGNKFGRCSICGVPRAINLGHPQQANLRKILNIQKQRSSTCASAMRTTSRKPSTCGYRRLEKARSGEEATGTPGTTSYLDGARQAPLHRRDRPAGG